MAPRSRYAIALPVVITVEQEGSCEGEGALQRLDELSSRQPWKALCLSIMSVLQKVVGGLVVYFMIIRTSSKPSFNYIIAVARFRCSTTTTARMHVLVLVISTSRLRIVSSETRLFLTCDLAKTFSTRQIPIPILLPRYISPVSSASTPRLLGCRPQVTAMSFTNVVYQEF